MDSSLFTRDQHLLDLALERLVLDDLEPAAALKARAHLAGCDACEARHRAIAAELAQPLPELAPVGGRAQQRRSDTGIMASILRMRWLMGGVGATVAAAAVALVMMLPQVAPELDPEFQRRGSDLSFEVYRQDDRGAVRLQDGDGVRPGDRLGFRVASQDAGYLLVFGIDATQATYPCFPSDAARGAQAWAASPKPVQLDAAIELDATPGQERLVALLCDEPMQLENIAPALRSTAAGLEPWQELPPLDLSCLQRELRVVKLEEAP